MIIKVLFALLLFAAMPPATPILELKPADEGPSDRSFASYRASLTAAIKHRDVNALVKLIDRNIKLDFGGGEGLAAFKSNWKVYDQNTQVWKALEMVVNNGGHFNSRTQFAAPYVYSAWPNDVDAFEFAVMTMPHAELYSGPHESRPVIAKIGYQIVQVLKGAGKPQHEATDEDWSEVKTANGTRGFVKASEYRSPVDFRAIFEKKRGKWRMTAFIAGD